jgi:hypothetical protein
MRKKASRLASIVLAPVMAVTGLVGIARSEPTATIEFAKPVVRQGESSSYTFKGTTSGAPGPYATNLVAGYIFNGEPAPSFMNITGHTIYSDCGDNCGTYQAPSILAGEQVNSAANFIVDNTAEVFMVVSAGNFGLPEPSGDIARFDFTVPANTSPGIYTNNIVEAGLSIYDGDFGYFTYSLLPENLTHGTLTVQPSLDINGDGSVNTLDDQMFADVLLGSNVESVPRERSDQNMDGTVNGEDIGPYIDGRING